MNRRFTSICPIALDRRYTRVPEPDAATLGFCASILRGASAPVPVPVPIKPDPAAEPRRCFWNVRDKVMREEGECLFGWALFEFPGAYRDAQHHAVWRSPDGQLVDVTPAVYTNMTQTLFLEDRTAVVDCDALEPMILPFKRLGASVPEVQTYMAFYPRIERAKQYVLPGHVVELDPEVRRLRKLERVAKRDMLLAIASALDGNDPCLCGSATTFTSCCACHFS